MEEELLLQQNQRSLADYLAVGKRRYKVIAAITGTLFVFFLVVLVLWPPSYQSKAVILIEEQDVPPELVPSTVTSYAVQRVEEIKQKIMTNANIIDIVERFQLLTPSELKRKTRTEIATDFRNNVAISPISAEVMDPRSGRPTQATIAFTVSFKGKNINTVHKVTNELVTLLLNENLKERTEQSESTAQFLSSEANALDQLLKDYERKISQFKEMHKSSLPELNTYNLNIVDRGHQEILSIQTRIQDLENRKINLASQLTQLDKSAPTILPSGEAILGPADRLKALHSELSYKRSVYKPEHPDLIRLEREIAALTSEDTQLPSSVIAQELSDARLKLIEALDQYTVDAPIVNRLRNRVAELEKLLEQSSDVAVDLPADNPSYILVKTQIDSIDSEIASLRDKAKVLEQRIAEHEGFLQQSPVVEKEYQALLRDYENSRIKYREIKAKLMTADLARNLEQERKGERFTLIQPPEIPEKPVSPNIKMLSVLGFVLCLGMGTGGGLLSENLDSRVYGEKRIVQITKMEPLVAIPYLITESEKSKERFKVHLLIASVIAMFLIFITAIHLVIKPLDVLWFVILRKLGLS